MEVHFTRDQEANLARVAAQAGMATEDFVKISALRAVEDRMRFSARGRKGIAQADRGELIDDDEARGWLEQQETPRLNAHPLHALGAGRSKRDFRLYRAPA